MNNAAQATIQISDDGAVEDVVMAFATSESADATAWMARFPGAAGEIARVAACRWASGGADTTGASVAGRDAASAQGDMAPSVARVRAIGLEALQACCVEVPAPALTSLVDAARARGLSPALLASRLGLPLAYVGKLQRRIFAAASVPAALIDDLARAIDRNGADVRAFLSASGPQMAHGASFSSDARPEVGEQEDFGTVLANDTAVSEQIRARYAW